MTACVPQGSVLVVDRWWMVGAREPKKLASGEFESRFIYVATSNAVCFAVYPFSSQAVRTRDIAIPIPNRTDPRIESLFQENQQGAQPLDECGCLVLYSGTHSQPQFQTLKFESDEELSILHPIRPGFTKIRILEKAIEAGSASVFLNRCISGLVGNSGWPAP
jgi:hypothetical protein